MQAGADKLGWMNTYLLPALEFGPQIMRRIIGLIEPSKLDVPSEPGRFTPREVIAHLADWEPIMLARIHTAVNSPGAKIESYDEGAMAVEHDYAHSDVREQLRKFAADRMQTVAFVRSLTKDDWGKTAVHPERGEQTALDLAHLLNGHDTYHIEQLLHSV